MMDDSTGIDDGAGVVALPAYDPYAPIRSPTAQELSQWGTNVDASYLQKIRGAIGNWWQQYQAAQPPTPPTVAPPSGPQPGAYEPPSGIGQAPPDIFNAPLTKPFDQKFAPPPMLNLGGPTGISYLPPGPVTPNAPQFTAPRAGAPPVFGMPNTPQVQSGPSADYQKAWQEFLASQNYANKPGAR